jgi:protein O-mannosyl-transferase
MISGYTKKDSLRYLAIIVLAIFAYFPTFSGEFILDDNALVKNNSFIKESHSLLEYFNQEDSIVDKADLSDYHSGYYRPLINLTYRLDYMLWGMNAVGFRITNLILHILCCLIIYKLINFFADKEIAFWMAILFCVHPVNTESVSFIASRNNIIVTLFIVCSFFFYVIGWERKSYLAYVVSVVLFAGAVFAKEFGLMVIPVFFLYQRLLCKQKDNLIKEIISYIPFVIISIVYLVLRNGVTNSILTPSDVTGFWTRIYFIPYIIFWNFKLIFLPHNLHFFVIPYPSNIYDLYAIISILLFLVIIAALWITRRNKLIVFSGLSFILLMFPILGIISTSSSSIIAMRWLYVPMTFMLIGIGVIIKKGLVIRRQFVTFLLVTVTIYLGIYTFTLNRGLWHDQDALIRQEALGFNNPLFFADMAEKYLTEKNYDEAEKYFRLAIEKRPSGVFSYISFSTLLTETGRPEIAISFLDKAKGLTRSHRAQGEWADSMGRAFVKMGEMEKGLQYFKKAIIYYPEEPVFWANLGGAYGMMGDYRSSIDALKKGIVVAPESVQLWTNLAMTYINLKDYKNAISALKSIPEEKTQENSEISRLLKLARDGLQGEVNNQEMLKN